MVAAENICQSCGACCATSANWPRFSTEDDSALGLIPAEFVNARGSGMRCDGDRCTALKGKVGDATSCTIYEVRPDVCRTCEPGDAECAMARRKWGLPVLASGSQAVTASATSSSSSSSIGAKVESGLVESVIGLRWP